MQQLPLMASDAAGGGPGSAQGPRPPGAASGTPSEEPGERPGARSGEAGLCGDLNAHVPAILAEWQAVAREEPWLSLPEEHRFDSIPDLLRELLRAALCGREAAPRAYRAMVESAVEHGRQRRGQGFAHDLILSEYYLLREAVRRHLARTRAGGRGAVGDLLRVDAAISVATHASVLGYHRAEIEALGRWPAVIEGVAGEWRLVVPADGLGRGAPRAAGG
jgi:hypothetical protein